MTNGRMPESSGNDNGQEEFDWEKDLEQLRRQRHSGGSGAERQQVQRPVSPQKTAAQAKPAQEETRLNAKAAERMLREYLQQWQQEHNDPLADTVTAETDTTVLLQEDWLAAQTALQSAQIDDSKLESKRTVWLNPKRQSVSFAEPVAQQHDHETVQQQEEGNVFEAAAEAEEWLPVTVKVINPQVDPRKPVMCLSEQELLERLTRRLRPHLTDAVAGMVRVAVQKQTAVLTYQLQQVLSEQTPAVVEEILDYNLKAAMSEIKYSLKYKR